MTGNVAAILNTPKRSVFARLTHNLQRMYRRHALFCVRRGEARAAIESRTPLTFQLATSENLSDALTFRPQEKVSAFGRRLEQGEVGVFAYHGQRAVAHGLMIVNRCTSPIYANRYFRLRPGEALVHFCNVDENERGKGIYQALLCELYRVALESEAVNIIYVDTERANIPSVKAIAKTANFLTNQNYLSVASHMVELRWPWKATHLIIFGNFIAHTIA